MTAGAAGGGVHGAAIAGDALRRSSRRVAISCTFLTLAGTGAAGVGPVAARRARRRRRHSAHLNNPMENFDFKKFNFTLMIYFRSKIRK